MFSAVDWDDPAITAHFSSRAFVSSIWPSAVFVCSHMLQAGTAADKPPRPSAVQDGQRACPHGRAREKANPSCVRSMNTAWSRAREHQGSDGPRADARSGTGGAEHVPSHSSTARPSRGPLPERAALMRPIAFAENWTCELSAARWARLPTPRICRIRPGLRRAAARPDRGRRLRRPATAYSQRKSSGRQPLTQGEHRHPLSFPQNHPEEGDGVLAVDVLEGRILGGVVHVHAAALQGGQRLVGMTAGLAAAPGAGLA